MFPGTEANQEEVAQIFQTVLASSTEWLCANFLLSGGLEQVYEQLELLQGDPTWSRLSAGNILTSLMQSESKFGENQIES